MLAAQVQHLPGDHVEEGHALAHAEQGLGPVHAHRGAEAAVELDHRRRAQRRGAVVVVDLDVARRLAVERLDRGLGDHPGLAVLEQPVVVGEGLDGDRVDAGVAPSSPARASSPALLMLAIVGLPGAAAAIPTGRSADLCGRCGEDRPARPDPHRAQPVAASPSSGRWAATWPTVVTAHPEVRRAATVAAYVSVGTEPGTGALLEALAALGKRVILPVVLPDMDLDWGTWRGSTSLVPARYGLLEPVDRLGLDAIAHGRRRCCVPGHGRVVDRRAARPGRRLLRPGAGPGAGRHPRRCLLYDDEVGLDVPVDDARPARDRRGDPHALGPPPLTR